MPQRIRSAKLRLFVSRDGSVNSPVLLTQDSDPLFVSPLVAPPNALASIQNQNGLSINVGAEFLVWSRQPREWKFTYNFRRRGFQISTDDAGETLYWSVSEGSDKVYVNSREPSLFIVG